MKIKSLLFAFSVIILMSAFNLPEADAASGKNRDLGVGLILGEPTGFNAKLWTADTIAFDAGLAFSLDDYVLVYLDYLSHYPGAFGGRDRFSRNLVPYFGLGAVLALGDRTEGVFKGDDIGLGARIPLGIEWLPDQPRLGLFIEVVPGMSIIPDTDGFVQGGFGIRYYF